MNKIRHWRIVMIFALMLLVVPLVGLACDSDDDEDTTTAPAADTAPAETAVETAETKGKIVLVEQDWDGNLVTTAVAQILLEQEVGYEVELKFAPADSAPMMIGLETGDFDFVCCNWPSFSHALLAEYVDSDNPTVERLGPSGVEGTSKWYVPTYLIKGDAARGIQASAPDLQSYQQLNQYKDLFSTADTRGKGRLLDFTPAWDYRNQERLDALGVDFEVVFSGSEAASFAELDASYKRGDPILLPLWAPHWSHVKYDLTEIQLPTWTEACYPAGTEYKCDWPIDPVQKLTWPGLKDKFPDAYQFLQNLTIDNAQQNEMVFNVAEGGMTPLEAAQLWVDDNEAIWRPWIP